MSTIERKTVVSEEGVAFVRGEEMTAGLGLFPLAAEAIQERFKFRTVEHATVNQVQVWSGLQGTLRVGKREYQLDSLRGHGRMLVVSVAAETEEARDVLQACFQVLREIERDMFGPQPSEGQQAGLPIGQLGEPFTATIAVVRLPFRFEEMVPSAAFLVGHVNDRLKAQGKKVAKEPDFKFNWTFRFDIGSRNLNQSMAIEPRSGDSLDSRMYFTRSPLATNEHFEMLELLCARMKSAPASGRP